MLVKIVSGGQTGVDRAALDAAFAAGLPCGGWCPKGRKAEDGRIDHQYPLLETDSEFYQVRTERNVRESDGTLILFEKKTEGGTALTTELAEHFHKPCLCIDLTDGHVSISEIVLWLGEENIKILNVAGPRESSCPGVYAKAREIVLSLVNECQKACQ